MSPGATFERVYHALKEQLGSGRFAAGAHLEPALLSHELNASITPVRDALHRLAGEGLLDTPRGDGFRTPPATEVGLRHLYRWNEALLRLAVRSRAPPGAAAAPDGAGDPETAERFAADCPVAWAERLFAAVALRPGNPEHAAAIARLSDRLRPVRHVERAVLDGPPDELAALAAALAAEDAGAMRQAIARYHRRRERAVGEIVAALVGPR